MSDEARVFKIPNDLDRVDETVYKSKTPILTVGDDMLNLMPDLERVTLPIRQFGNSITYSADFDPLYVKAKLDRDARQFEQDLRTHCKNVYLADTIFISQYEPMRNEYRVAWSVRAASPQFEFFAEILPKIREVEVEVEREVLVERKVYVPVYPTTIRACIKRAWFIFKMKWSKS